MLSGDGPRLTVPFHNPPRCWFGLSSRGKVSAAPGEGTHTGPLAHAVDFALPIGTPVLAAAAGVVVATRDGEVDEGGTEPRKRWLANWVAIKHAPGAITRYFHLQRGSICVKQLDQVRRGQQIACSGNSGFSRGPHLHFDRVRWLADGTVNLHVAHVPADTGGHADRGGPCLPRLQCRLAAFSGYLAPGAVSEAMPFAVVDDPAHPPRLPRRVIAVVWRGGGAFAALAEACERAGAAVVLVVNDSNEPAPLFTMYGAARQAAVPIAMVAAGAGEWLRAHSGATLALAASPDLLPRAWFDRAAEHRPGRAYALQTEPLALYRAADDAKPLAIRRGRRITTLPAGGGGGEAVPRAFAGVATA